MFPHAGVILIPARGETSARLDGERSTSGNQGILFMYQTETIATKTRNVMLTVTVLSGMALSSPASAIEYRTDQPMVITYQNDYGAWNGCGPVQCTASNWDSQEKVVDLVTHEVHGYFSYLDSVGRCQVYQSSGELRSYDKSPNEIADLVQSKC